MTGAQLPEGWTLRQIRDVSGDQEASVRHLITDGTGIPLACTLTGGNRRC
jgi:hypothetical protein